MKRTRCGNKLDLTFQEEEAHTTRRYLVQKPHDLDFKLRSNHLMLESQTQSHNIQADEDGKISNFNICPDSLWTLSSSPCLYLSIIITSQLKDDIIIMRIQFRFRSFNWKEKNYELFHLMCRLLIIFLHFLNENAK